MSTIVKCPQCGIDVIWNKENPWRPFCSERCKLIDFGDWVEENNRIPGKPANPWDQDENPDALN
jgi:hypothetical protein